MTRRLLHALVFVVGVLACAYVSVVLTFGTVSVMQWSRRGVPQRAFWVGLSTGAILIPGVVIAGLSVWYLRTRRRRSGELRKGFEVLPPR
jgi:hypothetical protein